MVVCHLVGDFLLQTDWQATHKRNGLAGDPVAARRALVSHVSVYTFSCLPALIWIADERSIGWAVLTAALIFFPHLIQDDGRLVRLFARKVKGLTEPAPSLFLMMDQSFHAVALFAVALLVGF